MAPKQRPRHTRGQIPEHRRSQRPPRYGIVSRAEPIEESTEPVPSIDPNRVLDLVAASFTRSLRKVDPTTRFDEAEVRTFAAELFTGKINLSSTPRKREVAPRVQDPAIAQAGKILATTIAASIRAHTGGETPTDEIVGELYKKCLIPLHALVVDPVVSTQIRKPYDKSAQIALSDSAPDMNYVAGVLDDADVELRRIRVLTLFRSFQQEKARKVQPTQEPKTLVTPKISQGDQAADTFPVSRTRNRASARDKGTNGKGRRKDNSAAIKAAEAQLADIQMRAGKLIDDTARFDALLCKHVLGVPNVFSTITNDEGALESRISFGTDSLNLWFRAMLGNRDRRSAISFALLDPRAGLLPGGKLTADISKGMIGDPDSDYLIAELLLARTADIYHEAILLETIAVNLLNEGKRNVNLVKAANDLEDIVATLEGLHANTLESVVDIHKLDLRGSFNTNEAWSSYFENPIGLRIPAEGESSYQIEGRGGSEIIALIYHFPVDAITPTTSNRVNGLHWQVDAEVLAQQIEKVFDNDPLRHTLRSALHQRSLFGTSGTGAIDTSRIMFNLEFPQGNTLKIFEPLCSALGAASGSLGRDFKPTI